VKLELTELGPEYFGAGGTITLDGHVFSDGLIAFSRRRLVSLVPSPAAVLAACGPDGPS
jgi:hypothetical protein